MKKAIFASALASLLIAGSAFAAGYTFSNYLTVGSTGADVVALQSWLVANNYLVMPAGVSMGYFGQLTKAAVVKYQAAIGLPSTGFVGPLTVAKLNGSAVMTTTAACPAGYTCTPVAGTVTTTTSTGGAISTPGVEGTILVTEDSSGVKSSVYEGDTMDSVLGFKVEAKTSDMLVQRVKVQIGTSTNSYTKVFSKIYLTDANGNVLAWKDLNGSTVDRDSSTQYSVSLTGFSALVRKDTKSSFFVKFDLQGGINNTYRYAQVILPVDGVRATDGAGIDQHGPTVAITKSPSVSGSLSDNATITISTDPDVIKAQTVVANGGSNSDEADMVTVGSFRILAEKDGVLVRDLNITASSTFGYGSQPTAYLFNGSTQIGSASLVGGTTTVGTYSFTSIDQTIAKDQTKVYTVKVDVRSAQTTADLFQIVGVSVPSAESVTSGSTVSGTGNGLTTVGNTISFVNKGAVTTLASTPSINITSTKDQNGNTTEVHLAATFNVNISALGADAIFNGTSTAFAFKIYKGSSDVTSSLSTFSKVEYNLQNLPSGFIATTAADRAQFTVPRNVSGTLPVTLRVDVIGGTSTVNSNFPNDGSYSVRLSTITYVSGGSTVVNDNSTNQAWVTAPASRP
jgi:peptidoglycan hydrolase-like protein with peptidoglycan-binding domain